MIDLHPLQATMPTAEHIREEAGFLSSISVTRVNIGVKSIYTAIYLKEIVELPNTENTYR